MLNIKNISKTFNTKRILDNISLVVQRGTIAVLLGESGVGKSTLLRVLNNLETVDAGTITLDNKKLDPITMNKDHLIGMVFQSFNLFEHLTAEQNITLPLEKVMGKSKQEAKTIAQQLLKQYSLLEKKDSFISALSGGQKQRLALARTLALKPQIICLDEPTSALDPLLTTHVANNIQALANQGYIVLVASHDTALLEKLDCAIYLMQEGRIVQSASSADFMQNKDKYPLIKRFVAGTLES